MCPTCRNFGQSILDTDYPIVRSDFCLQSGLNDSSKHCSYSSASNLLWKLQTSRTEGGSPISMCIFVIFSFRWKNWQSTWTQMIWEESILRTSATEFLLSKVRAHFLKITHLSATNVSLVAGNVMIKASMSAREQQDAFLLNTGINSYNPQRSILAFFFLSFRN